MAIREMPQIPVPEPGLTPDGLVLRARAMQSRLRERQAQCEQMGRLPESTNEEFAEAGFYRVVQPRIFGGYEFDVPQFMRLMIEVARGCPASGWVLALTAGHPLLLAAFEPEAQVWAYGEAGDFRAPLVAMPTGVAQPADGGYSVSGNWDYASGCDVATHFMCSAILPGEKTPEGRLRLVTVIVPRTDFTIVDNWDVLGMRGTGSRRVVLKEVFVPHVRTRPGMFGFDDPERPGLVLHPNPMYAGRHLSFLTGELASVAVGIARAALDEYEAMLREKPVLGPPPMLKRFEHHQYQSYFGQAHQLVDTAESALLSAGAHWMEWARMSVELRIPFDDEKDIRIVMVEQKAAAMAAEAVDLLFRTYGTSAAKPGSRLERYVRDMAVLRTHPIMQEDRWRENFSRHHFGLPASGMP
jgi:3-hydroxy-9,10-secoandrosta-1,3,5(10)-triene-9,17-dione monooxygenase